MRCRHFTHLRKMTWAELQNHPKGLTIAYMIEVCVVIYKGNRESDAYKTFRDMSIAEKWTIALGNRLASSLSLDSKQVAGTRMCFFLTQYSAESRSGIGIDDLRRSLASKVAIVFPPTSSVSSSLRVSKSPASMVPVSKAFQIPGNHPLRIEIIEALQAIDSVHGDGSLPNIPLTSETEQALEGRLGRYCGLRGGRKKKPQKIMLCAALCREAKITRLTVVHEVGHLLAHMAIGEAGQYWGDVSQEYLPREVRAWKRAVEKSDSWDAHKKSCFDMSGPGNDPAVVKKLSYRGDLDELWARSYSQFIAVRSKHKRLLAEFRRAQENNPASYWEANDFKDINMAIETIFRQHQWL